MDQIFPHLVSGGSSAFVLWIVYHLLTVVLPQRDSTFLSALEAERKSREEWHGTILAALAEHSQMLAGMAKRAPDQTPSVPPTRLPEPPP